MIEPFGFPLQVQDGGRTQVTCSISSGDLPIKVSWTKDGRPIATNLNVEMQTGEFHSLLIFKKLRGEHSGVYTCTARNLAKAASHSATLLVQGPFFLFSSSKIENSFNFWMKFNQFHLNGSLNRKMFHCWIIIRLQFLVKYTECRRPSSVGSASKVFI